MSNKMGVLAVADDLDFQYHLRYRHGNKLIVVVFIAKWSGRWLRMSPVLEQLSRAYSKAVFLKVDVDVCRATAASHGITGLGVGPTPCDIVPSFGFYRDRVRLDVVLGGNQQELEEKLKQYYDAEIDSSDEPTPEGQIDLMKFISECEALNESPQHQLMNCLKAGEAFLESSSDCQLIISIFFSHPVKIHSLRVKGPTSNGPKTLKLYINQPSSLGFDEARSRIPTQKLDLNTETLESGSLIALQFVKFQNVQNIHFLIEDNQDGSEVTRIDRIQLFGTVVNIIKMNNVKWGKNSL